MKTFQEFITEGRDAPLYHGTIYSSAESIIAQGQILPATNHNSFSLLKTPYKMVGGSLSGTKYLSYKGSMQSYRQITGISTSRSLSFAKKWANDYNINGYCIFELDQRAIAQRYEIKPFNYYNSKTRHEPNKGMLDGDAFDISGNEYEEYIITTKPLSIRYVSALYCSKDRLNDIKELCNKYNRSIIVRSI